MFSLRKPREKGTLRRKIMLNSVSSFILISLLTFSTYYYIFYLELKQRFELRATSLVSSAAILIDGETHDRLRTRAEENSDEYREIQKVLQGIKKANPDSTYIHTMRKLGEEDKWEIVVDAQTQDALHIGDIYDAAGQDTLLTQAYAGAIAVNRLMTGEWGAGAGLCGFAPIKNSNGQSVGIVHLHLAADNFSEQKRKVLLWGLAIFVISLGFSFYTTRKRIRSFTLPIEMLTAGVNRFRAGEYEHRVYIQTGDEFETLGNALNSATDLMVDYQRMLEDDLQNTRVQREKIFKVYRDVIYAVTQGKFNLLTSEESVLLASEGVLKQKIVLAVATDVNTAREATQAYLQKRGCSQQRLFHIILSISEAATNVIKHAGQGVLQIRALEHGVRVSVADQGPGMDFDKLPNMIFLQGFSTKISMGYGFSIIYRFADKVYLSTSERGTYLAMDFLNL